MRRRSASLPPAPSVRRRPIGRGPVLGAGTRRLRRRRVGATWRKALIPLVMVAAAASWVFVIGPDLRADPAKKRTKLAKQTARLKRAAARRSAAKASAANTTAGTAPLLPAGPGGVAPPQAPAQGPSRGPVRAPMRPLVNELRARAPVSHALLSAARDHVARGVHAAWGSVPDRESIKGADVDLIDRGLHLVGFSLRDAVIHHRFREPYRYDLRRRPLATAANRKRALTTKNLRVFLDRYAKQLPRDWDGVAGDTYQAGDVVLLESRAGAAARRNRRFGRRKMFAVVSDRTNDDGVSLVITLDPRDREALERWALSRYRVLRHYRLTKRALAAVPR